jgi:hypothetical protein
VEEHTLPVKVIIAHMTRIYPTLDHTYPCTVSQMHDYEFKLVAVHDIDLIIFHHIAQWCSIAQMLS